LAPFDGVSATQVDVAGRKLYRAHQAGRNQAPTCTVRPGTSIDVDANVQASWPADIEILREDDMMGRSDLPAWLRERDRDQIIICGVYAHVGVLMSAVEAFTNDIQPFLVADTMGDFSMAYHGKRICPLPSHSTQNRLGSCVSNTSTLYQTQSGKIRNDHARHAPSASPACC